MSKYQHSQTFANLKGIQESISTNLTSFQYLSVLDYFLYRSIQPLIQNTRFVDIFLAQILGWQTQNPKRKTTGAGRHTFSANTTLFLLLEDPVQKMKVLRSMRLDRAIIFETIRRWLSIVAEYETLSNQIATPELTAHLYDLNDKASMRSSFSLHATYSMTKLFYEEASKFKTMILEKYTRMVLNTAQRDYVQMGHQVELEVIIQVYLMTAYKAIDKCDTERGVLTTHIQNWLLSAKNVVKANHMQNAVRALGQTQGKQIADQLLESVPLDDIADMPMEESDANEREATIDSVRTVALAFDPSGVGRILLGIQEILSKEDKMIIRAMAVPLNPPQAA